MLGRLLLLMSNEQSNVKKTFTYDFPGCSFPTIQATRPLSSSCGWLSCTARRASRLLDPTLADVAAASSPPSIPPCLLAETNTGLSRRRLITPRWHRKKRVPAINRPHLVGLYFAPNESESFASRSCRDC